mgnify:CR=1 FL=1
MRHTLSVEMVYRGNSDLFSYLQGYVFKLRSKCDFYATRGRVIEISVIGYERGGVTADLEDKPSIRCVPKVIQNKASKSDADDKGAAK